MTERLGRLLVTAIYVLQLRRLLTGVHLSFALYFACISHHDSCLIGFAGDADSDGGCG
jgi:hypothetical protein